jgi:short-subunit dehydrogenase
MNNQSIIITGASTGIGKACALGLDKIGFKVYAGVRKENDGQLLMAEASERLTPILLDVTKADMIENAVETLSGEADYPLTGLVNNAGLGISGVLELPPVDEFAKLMEVNVIGLHAMTRAFLPLLRKNKGRIVNIGSISSFVAMPGASSYAASKFAVRALTDALRLEVTPFGMSVSLVAPGAIESEIWDKGKAYKAAHRKTITPEMLETYQLYIKAGDKIIEQTKPIPAEAVVKVVTHALTANRPKFNYLVGGDAKKAYAFSKLPKRLFNCLVLKRLTKIAAVSK